MIFLDLGLSKFKMVTWELQKFTFLFLLISQYCNGGDLADYLRGKYTVSRDSLYVFLKLIF